MFSSSPVKVFKMKLLITSLIFTLAAARIVFKTPEQEARFDAGNSDKYYYFLRAKFHMKS